MQRKGREGHREKVSPSLENECKTLPQCGFVYLSLEKKIFSPSGKGLALSPSHLQYLVRKPLPRQQLGKTVRLAPKLLKQQIIFRELMVGRHQNIYECKTTLPLLKPF